MNPQAKPVRMWRVWTPWNYCVGHFQVFDHAVKAATKFAALHATDLFDFQIETLYDGRHEESQICVQHPDKWRKVEEADRLWAASYTGDDRNFRVGGTRIDCVILQLQGWAIDRGLPPSLFVLDEVDLISRNVLYRGRINSAADEWNAEVEYALLPCDVSNELV